MLRTRWTVVALLAALISLTAACSGDEPADAPATKAAETAGPSTAAPAAPAGTVRAVISEFTLPTLTVQTGTVVEFVNQDTAQHTATSDDKTTFDSKTLAPGSGSFKFTATKAGSFPYSCLLHPSMKGTITVQ